MANNQFKKSTNQHQNSMHPLGNTGITQDNRASAIAPEPARLRANIELSPQVSLCLDHICEVTGSTRSQLINAALLDALPGLIERADLFSKRSRELVQVQASKKR
jgi:predicted transcriptional regulator